MVISVVMGLYLLGKIRMTHDSETKTIGIGQLLMAIVAFSFAGYLFTGLLGSPLQNISSFLPPQERKLTLAAEKSTVSSELCGVPKYSDILDLPFNLNGYFDYRQGMECAHKLHKPVLLDFKGHTCSNCKKMENSVWSNPDILQQLNNEFVIIALYTDDFTELPKNEWVQSVFDDKIKKTIGEINADFQTTHYKTNTLPMYVIVDNDGNTIAKPVSYDPDVKKFDNFLKTGIKAFNNTK
jgi:thiol:disulfide interchange protein DsbD